MKSKKWIVIGCISLALIVAEILLFFLLVMPGMSKTKAMNELLDGDADDAAELFGDMSPEKVQDLQGEVKDIVVYQANRCLEGTIEYEDFFETMDAVESVSTYSGLTEDAFAAVNIPKMKKLYEEGITAYLKSAGGKDYTAKKTEFLCLRKCKEKEDGDEIYHRWSKEKRDTYNKAVETAMDALLKEKYESYQADKLDYDKMNAAAQVAMEFWYSDYTYDVINGLRDEQAMKEEYDRTKEYFDKQDYWNVFDKIEQIRDYYKSNSSYEKWREKFVTLYEEAETKAKTYYVEEAVKAAKNGDTSKAEELMEQLKKHFGKDFDVSAITDSMHSDWQKGYVEFMANWQSNLKSDFQTKTKVSKQVGEIGIKLEDNEPTKIFLYDFDDNGTPEMILTKDSILFIYTFKDGKVKYTGYVPWLGLGNKPALIIGMPITVEGGAKGSFSAVLKFVDYDWKLEDFCITATKGSDTQYVTGTGSASSGTKVDEKAYDKMKKSINNKITSKTLKGGASIADYEKYIYDFDD